MKEKLKILFLCTGNSCRSQMAEAWTRSFKKDWIEPYSAGVELHGVNPDAVRVMEEAGVDMTGQESKHIDQFKDTQLDVVITLCGHARETCPWFPPRCRVIHVGFEDPPRMAMEVAQQGGGREEQLDCYRKVRDEIRAFVEQMPENLFE